MNRYMDIEGFSSKVREMGYPITRLPLNYSKGDNRVWGVAVSAGDQNVLVFYYRNRTELGDQGFDVLSSNRNYFGISAYEIYDAVDKIITFGRYDNE